MDSSQLVDQYIAAQTDQARPLLEAIRATIRAAAPQASEKMSYQMPTFWQGRNLIHYAAFTHHIGLYPGAEAVAVFADRLTDYRTSKGTIQLPYSRPIDYQLISDIVAWRVAWTAAR